jgi:uncharacterized damage-inducible protein DinB
VLVVGFLIVPAFASAQAPANPISQSLTNLFQSIKQNLVESAQQASPEIYAFKPTPEVRSFGQIIGHVADANYFFCSSAKGEASPNKVQIEKTVTSKDALVKALTESFTYCDSAFSAATDAKLAEMRKAPPFMGGQSSAAGFLAFAVAHGNEHYGNIVTYLRLKGVVPPSTARQQ